MDLMHLVAELDELLQADAIADYCPNGLQVEGRPDVQHVVTAVSASRALFERAIALDADLILVHHGLLWATPMPPPPVVVTSTRTALTDVGSRRKILPPRVVPVASGLHSEPS